MLNDRSPSASTQKDDVEFGDQLVQRADDGDEVKPADIDHAKQVFSHGTWDECATLHRSSGHAIP